jgi:hypothetical protein
MHASDIEIDRVALAAFDRDREFGTRLRELEEWVRNIMAVDIGDHH